jgi:hypothetical protein
MRIASAPLLGPVGVKAVPKRRTPNVTFQSGSGRSAASITSISTGPRTDSVSGRVVPRSP